MKIFVFLFSASVLFFSCNSKKINEQTIVPAPAAEGASDTSENFFPVTNFLRGEIAQIKNIGITPLKKQYSGEKVTDSVWLKPEDFEKDFSAFLFPEIDSVNLKPYYTQKKFLDQSVDAFTFTYDPIGPLTDSMPLLHWDVYVDPKSGRVRRIFIRKKKRSTEETQLTWQSEKWCRIVDLKNTGTNTVVVSDTKIAWSFD